MVWFYVFTAAAASVRLTLVLIIPGLPVHVPLWVLISLTPLVFQGSDPTAFSVLTQAITGQVGFVDAEFCTTCGGKGADKRCSVCKMVRIKEYFHEVLRILNASLFTV